MISFLLVLLISACSATNSSEQGNFSPSMLTNILSSFHGQKSVNITGLLSAFDLPVCFTKCVGDYSAILTNPDMLCPKFIESAECLKKSDCSGSLVDTMNGTLSMLCATNIENYASQLECLQNSTLDLQEECERDCSVQANILEKASKNQGDVLLTTENMCKSSLCLVQCYKKNMVTKCSVDNDNILNKIFASFETKSNRVDGFDKIMNWVIPENCKFENYTHVANAEKTGNAPKSVGSVVEKPKIVGTDAGQNIVDVEKSAEKPTTASSSTSTSTSTTSTTTIAAPVTKATPRMVRRHSNTIQPSDSMHRNGYSTMLVFPLIVKFLFFQIVRNFL